MSGTIILGQQTIKKIDLSHPQQIITQPTTLPINTSWTLIIVIERGIMTQIILLSTQKISYTIRELLL